MSLSAWFLVSLAVALPWLAGSLWMRVLWPAAFPGRWPMCLGYGYLLGFFGVALLLRLQGAAGLALWVWPAMLLSVSAAVAAVWLISRPAFARAAQASLPSYSRQETPAPLWQRVLFWLLFGWLAMRFAGLALEIWWRPVYSWDAWTTWALRARVWVEAGTLLPFVPARDWLDGTAGGAHTIEAAHYPLAVSLLAAWPGLATGAWHDWAANLPWLGCMLALGLGFYGQARLWGAPALTALLFTWLLLSLPILDTHAALAGYADLWLTTALGLASAASLQWALTRDMRQGVPALFLIACLPLLKEEGLVWALLFAPALLVGVARGYGLLALFALSVVLGIAVAATGGIGFGLGELGRLWIAPDRVELPLLGAYPLQLRGTWAPVVRHLLLYDNWHLLMYLLPVALAGALFAALGGRAEAWMLAGLVWTLLTLSALYILFFWTDAYRWAAEGTSVNRLVMHFTAGWLFWMMALWVWLTHHPRPACRSDRQSPQPSSLAEG